MSLDFLDHARDASLDDRSVPVTQTQYRIVDADAHVNPPPDFWAEYLPESLRELAPRIESEEDADYIVFEGNRRKLNLLNGQAGREGKNFKTEGRRSDMRAGGWMPAARIEDMDRDHMDAQVMFGGGPLGTSNQDLYIESFRAYNRWLADFCAYDPKRLFGVAYLPMRDLDESIAMLREVAKWGFRTINIPAFPQHAQATKVSSADGPKTPSMGGQATALTGDPDGKLQYDSPEFDRFWAEVIELDMTVSIHLGARLARFHMPERFLSDLLMTKFSMAEPIAILIFGGVFQRFPKLRFATVESGVGWFAFASNYMDRTWEKQRFWTKSVLTEPPSFYMDQNVFGSFINDRIGVECRHMPGAKNIMWSSDYPHSETTFPNSLDVIRRDFHDVPENEIREIICDRARRVFRIDG